MKEEIESEPVDVAKEIAFKNANVVIKRAFSHAGELRSDGYIWYKYSFNTKDGRHKGGVQVALSFEKRVGEKGVKEYVQKKYIDKYLV